MTKAEEKYLIYRPLAKQGDLILFHGEKWLHKLLQIFDSVNGERAYFNH